MPSPEPGTGQTQQETVVHMATDAAAKTRQAAQDKINAAAKARQETINVAVKMRRDILARRRHDIDDHRRRSRQAAGVTTKSVHAEQGSGSPMPDPSMPLPFPPMPMPEPGSGSAAPATGGPCTNRVSWGASNPYGTCSTYATGSGNHFYCSLDGALPHCSECGQCIDTTPIAPEASPPPAPPPMPGYPTPHLADLPPVGKGKGGGTPAIVPPCTNQYTFDAGYGQCNSYAAGQPNNAFCALDGANPHCPGCGMCSSVNGTYAGHGHANLPPIGKGGGSLGPMPPGLGPMPPGLFFIPPGAVSCPGLPVADYCDCGGDCTNQPTWCACAAATSCCAGAIPMPSPSPAP